MPNLIRALAALAAALILAASLWASSPASVVSPRARGTPVAWLVFVDDLHIEFRNTGRLQALLRIVVSELMEDGDAMGILSDGPSHLAVDLTADRSAVDRAIAEASGAALKPGQILSAPDDDRSEVRYRMHIALSTIYRGLERLNRTGSLQRAIIYVSNGYTLAPADRSPAPAATMLTKPGERFSVEQVRDEMAAVVTEASRSGIRIFTVDPRSMPGGLLDDPGVPPEALANHVATTRANLRLFSARTGAFAIADEDVAEGLQRANSAVRR